jgi:hypothetical protein
MAMTIWVEAPAKNITPPFEIAIVKRHRPARLRRGQLIKQKKLFEQLGQRAVAAVRRDGRGGGFKDFGCRDNGCQST